MMPDKEILRIESGGKNPAFLFLEPFSLLRGRVYMQSIEVSEKTLRQNRTVFQGLRGIAYGKGKNSPPP